ncbi:uncharacterized protein LOC125877330 [Solanum stenotomum]|uniref:uncharacterized protein LOC125877330 n=1 Tax=Solanum stenotomum TaxID=172797 RepID=UPI0020D1CC6F|nr:uncharacterized protein LOC125877330 [Solanum stenotomum]
MVRKEVIKWLDAGVVYPISDGIWVFHVQCVSKKDGAIVVTNDKNELIPTGIVMATFRRYMMVIFYDLVEEFIEIFMDNFSVFGEAFELCLKNHDRLFARYEENQLSVELGEMSFLAEISERGKKFSETCTFLQAIHQGFLQVFHNYVRGLLEKEVKFQFDESCIMAFEVLEKNFIEAPILIAPSCETPFELMYDASDVVVGVVPGQRKDKVFHSIYYGSKNSDSAQVKYIVTEKEMLSLVLAYDKFMSYLMKTVMFIKLLGT